MRVPALLPLLPLGAAGHPSAGSRPHIVSYILDDMGWWDTQVQNPDSVMTPTFGELAKNGIVLQRHHAYKYCSPTRRSFLSGRFPTSIGTGQASPCSNGSPLSFTWISEKLKQAGYEAHFIGKGHLGYQTTDHLPINRGFDSHVGYLWGGESYSHGDHVKGIYTKDMWEDDHPALDVVDAIYYSTNFYTDRAIARIQQRDTSKPFYLHMPYQAVHGPYSTPPMWECSNWSATSFNVGAIGNMLKVVDDGIANITAALQRASMWDTTLVILFSDNGAGSSNEPKATTPAAWTGRGESQNYPLRGRKATVWEGGTRVTALVSGGFVPKALRGTSSSAPMHVADWYPTMCVLAGVPPPDDKVGTDGKTYGIDGVDQWPAITGANTTNPRPFIPTTESSILWDSGNGTLYKAYVSARRSFWYTPNNTWLRDMTPCADGTDDPACEVCTAQQPCLFDVTADPSERTDIAAKQPAVLRALVAQLGSYTQYAKLFPVKNLSSYDCSPSVTAAWQNYTGPCCMPHGFPTPPPPPPTPAPPTPAEMCKACEDRYCPGEQGKGQSCETCVKKNKGAFIEAQCYKKGTGRDDFLTQWCGV